MNYHGYPQVDIKGYFEVINAATRENLQKTDAKIIIELGRSIVAEAVDLIIPIIQVRRKNGEKCLYLGDSVYRSFIASKVHGWNMKFKTLRDRGENGFQEDASIEQEYRVFGDTCDSGDTLGMMNLPKGLKEGDYIWLPSAGAYTKTCSSSFNGIEPASNILY